MVLLARMYMHACVQLQCSLFYSSLFSYSLQFSFHEVAKDAIDGRLLMEEEHVECKPERIPNSILNENVDICLIHQYFSSDAWLPLDTVIKTKMKNIVWICLST